MSSIYPKSERIPTDQQGVFEKLATPEKLALVTSPALPRGIGGLLLDIIEEDAIELSSDITDHYTENNTSIQDHVALRPETVTLHGIVSELAVLRDGSDAAQESTNPYDSRPRKYPLRDALPGNPAYAPELTPGAVQSKAAAQSPEKPKNGVLTKYEDAYGPIGAQKGKKQKDVFSYFYQLYRGRQFVTVETAWGIWPNMVIQTLRTEQGADSRFKSDFYVTFKPIRFASDLTIKTVKAADITDAQKKANEKLNQSIGGQSNAGGTTLLKKLIHTSPDTTTGVRGGVPTF